MPRTSGGPAAPSPVSECPETSARDALALMVQALELIDASDGAGVAGAHLDLAIHRLREWIDSSDS